MTDILTILSWLMSKSIQYLKLYGGRGPTLGQRLTMEEAQEMLNEFKTHFHPKTPQQKGWANAVVQMDFCDKHQQLFENLVRERIKEENMKVLTSLFPKPTHIGAVLRTAALKADVDGEVSDLMILAATYIRELEEQVRQFEMVTLARQLLEDFCEPNELPAPLVKDGYIKWDDFPTEGSKIIISHCREGYLVEGFGLDVQKRVECLPGKLNDALQDVITTLRTPEPSLVQRLQQLGECKVTIKEVPLHRQYLLDFPYSNTISLVYRVEGKNLYLRRIHMRNTENESVTIEAQSSKQEEGVLVAMVRTFLGV